MSSLRNLIKKQKSFYQRIGLVKCSLLKDTVYFTSEGFFHLTHKSNGKRRNISEQYLKLMCLSYSPDIIKNAVRIIQIRKEKHIVKGKIKKVVTYELVDDKKRNRPTAVVIERVGTGKLKFRSVKKISPNRFANKKAPVGA